MSKKHIEVPVQPFTVGAASGVHAMGRACLVCRPAQPPHVCGGYFERGWQKVVGGHVDMFNPCVVFWVWVSDIHFFMRVEVSLS